MVITLGTQGLLCFHLSIATKILWMYMHIHVHYTASNLSSVFSTRVLYIKLMVLSSTCLLLHKGASTPSFKIIRCLLNLTPSLQHWLSVYLPCHIRLECVIKWSGSVKAWYLHLSIFPLLSLRQFSHHDVVIGIFIVAFRLRLKDRYILQIEPRFTWLIRSC